MNQVVSEALPPKSSAAATNGSATNDWDAQLANLLQDLSSVQGDLLHVLAEKRQVILRGDAGAMTGLAARETDILSRLEACHRRRGVLLSDAQASGMPATSLTDLARRVAPNKSSSASQPSKTERDFQAAGKNFRKLQSESLSNWVLAQRSLLHVSQLLEIIATGGRIKPTYEKDASTHSRGNLVDSEA